MGVAVAGAKPVLIKQNNVTAKSFESEPSFTGFPFDFF
jgi:hypothetical protein